MAEKMYVKSALPQGKDGGYPIAINERDAAHVTADPSDEFPNGNPDGELFIADDKVHEVVVTAGVRAALNDGRLVESTKTGKVKGDTDAEPTPSGDSKTPAAGSGK